MLKRGSWGLHFSFKNNVIPIKLCKTDDGEYQVSRVMVSRKYVVPPETALRITGILESPIGTEYTFHPNRKKIQGSYSTQLYR